MSQSPDGQPNPDAHPQPFILSFHRYQERERVLQLAIQKRQLSNEGKKILVFPDYSARLVATRSAYKKVKAQLYEKNSKFSLRYPATLVVYFNGSDSQSAQLGHSSADTSAQMLEPDPAQTIEGMD